MRRLTSLLLIMAVLFSAAAAEAPQKAPVDMMWSVNGEELITIANKRLCNLASKETRELVQMICDKVIQVCPEFKDELVPMCVRNGGVCYEMFPCGDKSAGGI